MQATPEHFSEAKFRRVASRKCLKLTGANRNGLVTIVGGWGNESHKLDVGDRANQNLDAGAGTVP